MRSLHFLALAFCFGASTLLAAPPASKRAHPEALNLNTKEDEDEPHLAGTNTLYYTTRKDGKYTLMVATRVNAIAQWQGAKPVAGAATEVDDVGSFFVSEKTGFQYLFFATLKDKDSKNFDIYVAQRNDAKKPFSALTPVQAIATEEDEKHPWLLADGKQMYFSRRVDKHWRVFSITRPDAFGPQFRGDAKLVEELPEDFHHATVSTDGHWMYLQGPLSGSEEGKIRWGLYRCEKMKNGKWGKPDELTMLNDPDTKIGDCSPCLSRDRESSMLYFASDRPRGKGGLDLYAISVLSLKK